MKRSSLIVSVAILMLLMVGLQGCVGNGRFFVDQEATEAFMSPEIRPGMNYYIIGSDVNPDVLMGLNRNYVLDNTSWKKVDMTQALMKEIVSRMNAKASTAGQNLYGSVMLDQEEKPVGIWYSTDYLQSTTSLEFRKDNHLLIRNSDLEKVYGL